MAQQELSPLKQEYNEEKQEVVADTNNVAEEEEQPRKKSAAEKPDAAELFKMKLKENDGCCSRLLNICQIGIAAYHIKVLGDPYNTHTICYYPADGSPKVCQDEREFYEDAGLSITYLGFELAFLCVYVIVTILTMHALQRCLPIIFLIMWFCINVQMIFILLHSILSGVYWGAFALILPMLMSCYFWMLYNLSKYFRKGGVYDHHMSHLSPAPNNYAVLLVAKPDDLAHYHANYKNEKKKPIDSKQLFVQKMNEGFPMCCCVCTLQTWSIIWLVYMILQNLLWFGASVTTTVILYDDYGRWMDCDPDSAGLGTTDCRRLFEDNGLTRGYSVVSCLISGIAVTPLSNYAIFASSFLDKCGCATSVGCC